MNLAVQQYASEASSANLESTCLKVVGLSKSFGTHRVLKDVSVEIKEGSMTSLIGANGSGKSTLLRSSVYLIEPDSGEVFLFGKNLSRCSRREVTKVRRNVGFIFQYHNLALRLSALTNVVHGALGRSNSPRLWLQGLAPEAVRKQAMECLNTVGLGHVANRQVRHLSGGQSQRVAVARALMQEPSMLVADEPVASLDPQSGEEVMELFCRLNKEKGITVLFTSHNLEHATHYAERVIGLQSGRIELDSPTKAVSVEALRGFYE